MRIGDWSSDVCSADLIGRYCQRKRLNLSAPPRGFGNQPRCGLQRVQILDDRQRLRDPEFTVDQQRHATLRVERTIRFGKLLAAVPEEMDGHDLVRETFQVQGNADAMTGR